MSGPEVGSSGSFNTGCSLFVRLRRKVVPVPVGLSSIGRGGDSGPWWLK